MKKLDLSAMPGHLARRVQQIAVALFAQELAELNLTPVQYSALQTVCDAPGIDQKTLATTIGYDTSTIGGVIDRLEARGLLVRNLSAADKRLRLVTPTADGLDLLEAATPRMLRCQERLLEPLSRTDRKEFVRLMKALVDANAELSNIPARD
ncbi:MAG TPA: MarR family transcriptional regulator [Ramlibacter sp.]|jgi:DNA-binding MarR family transcriptional regulator